MQPPKFDTPPFPPPQVEWSREINTSADVPRACPECHNDPSKHKLDCSRGSGVAASAHRALNPKVTGRHGSPLPISHVEYRALEQEPIPSWMEDLPARPVVNIELSGGELRDRKHLAAMLERMWLGCQVNVVVQE